jgi:hypothetical protein
VRKAPLAFPPELSLLRTARRIGGAFLLLPLLLSPARTEPSNESVQPVAARPATQLPTELAARRARFLATLTEQARQNGIPPALADAVAAVESAYDPTATGEDGEVGLMQILPSTAAMLGFRGNRTALFEPETNIRYAVAYLARAWTLADGHLCRALMKYRAGHGEDQMSPLSVTYCRRAIAHLASIGSPLAAGPGAVLPPVTSEETARCGRRVDQVGISAAERARLRSGRRTEADMRRYEAAQQARIRALLARGPVRVGLGCRAVRPARRNLALGRG